MILLFYVSLAIEFGIWVVAIIQAFLLSGRWGWGTILGGAIPVVVITTILATLPEEEFSVESVSVLTLVMMSTLVFALYGPPRKTAATLSAHQPANA